MAKAITLKKIPEDVFEIIFNRQSKERDRLKRPVSLQETMFKIVRESKLPSFAISIETGWKALYGNASMPEGWPNNIENKENWKCSDPDLEVAEVLPGTDSITVKIKEKNES